MAIYLSTGLIVWGVNIDETHHSLIENLLHFLAFIKRKGHFITSDYIAFS